MANWKKVLVSGSSIEVANISASGDLIVKNIPTNNGSGVNTLVYDTTSGKIFYTGSYGGGGGGGDSFFTEYTTDNIRTTTPTNLYITGAATLIPVPTNAQQGTNGANTTASDASSVEGYAVVVSQSLWAWNLNAGHPSDLSWGANLNGSIFNNYNANTDISNILRTLVGIVSASNPSLVASPLPFNKNYQDYTITAESTPNSSNEFSSVMIPDGYTNLNALYLFSKGFNAGSGSALFSNVTSLYQATNNNWGILLNARNSDSIAGGGFNAGLTNTSLTLFASVTQSFSDTQSITNPSETNSTFVTRSFYSYITTTGTTNNGITLTEIPTGNPTLIPPQYQSASISSSPLQVSRRYASSGESFTAVSHISSSGYYRFHGIKAGIATGSTNINDVIGGALASPVSETNVGPFFVTPLDLDDLTPATITFNVTITPLTATSRSLSGAPYINSASYSASVTMSNAFSPFYYNGTIAQSSTINALNLTIAGAGSTAVISAGKTNAGRNIYTGDTHLASSTIPNINSTIRFNERLGWGAAIDNNDTNAAESGSLDLSFTYRIAGTNFKNSSNNGDTEVLYHTAGNFGQPVSSGSLLYFISQDGSNGSSDTTTEFFHGESRRRTISTADISGLSTAWDSGSRLTLGNGGALQVKPNFLVNPEHNGSSVATAGSGYWYPTTGFNSSHFKWYLREFETNGTTYNTFRADIANGGVGADLVTFDDATANKIAIGIIFSSSLGTGTGGNTEVFDLKKANGTYGGSLNNQSTSNQYNPFSSNIDIRGDWSSVLNLIVNSYTISLSNANNQTLNNTYRKFWVLVRYTGAPATTMTNIFFTGA